MDLTAWIVAALIVWIAFVALAQYVAVEKGRGSTEAFLLSGIFGPFGVLILALLPTLTEDELAAKIAARIAARKSAEEAYRERMAAPSVTSAPPTPDTPSYPGEQATIKRPALKPLPEVVEPIKVECPGCFRRFSVPGESAGKRTKCPGCGSPITIPSGPSF